MYIGSTTHKTASPALAVFYYAVFVQNLLFSGMIYDSVTAKNDGNRIKTVVRL